jgi:hypothetical protein
MSGEKEQAPVKRLKIHTQNLVAIASVSKALGWAEGDPIELGTTRAGKVTIENFQDPGLIEERARAYAEKLAAKEAEKKAKAEKKAAEAKAKKEAAEKAKAEKEADEAEAEGEEDAVLSEEEAEAEVEEEDEELVDFEEEE